MSHCHAEDPDALIHAAVEYGELFARSSCSDGNALQQDAIWPEARRAAHADLVKVAAHEARMSHGERCSAQPKSLGYRRDYDCLPFLPYSNAD